MLQFRRAVMQPRPPADDDRAGPRHVRATSRGWRTRQFSTPKELGRLLAESKACQKCIVKQLFRYAFGREETANDQPVIDAMLAKFRDSGFRFRELIVALVTSDLFLQKGSG